MKVRILSDLHLEGWAFSYDYKGEDVLILAGDITTRNRHHLFLELVPIDVKVLYVAGNHEYYHGVFENVNKYLKDLENSQRYNFKFLNNESYEYNGLPIYGGTMFTNWELFGPGHAFMAKHQAKDMINDFHVMSKMGFHYEDAAWTVEDHLKEYEKFESGLRLFLKHTEGAEKRLVISHFMPSEQSSHERFKGSNLNPYFVSNMESYMGWDGFWVHGHGHNGVDYMVGDTRVIANPRGYRMSGVAENHTFDQDLIIEI